MPRPNIPQDGLTGDVLLREAESEFNAVINLVRNAVAARLYPTKPDRWISLRAIYADHVIVNNEDQRLLKFTYSIDDKNEVTLGEAEEVKVSFVSLKEAVAEIAKNSSVFIEAVGDKNSGKWLIRVIKAGLSKNKKFYSDALLREAAPLFGGARVFMKSDAEHLAGQGKSVSNLIGGLSKPKFIEGASKDTGEIQATFTLIEADGDVSKKLREAYKQGMQDLLGFSIDADGVGKFVMRDKVRVFEATKITKVSSVDLIVEPGAGGELLRLVEAVDETANHQNQENEMLKQRMLEAIKKANPDAYAKLDTENISDEDLETAYREAIATPAPADDNSNNGEVLEAVRMVEARSNMRITIAESGLPDAAKTKLEKQFAARESFKDEDVTAAITAEREYLGNFTESGHVVLPFGDSTGNAEPSRTEKIKDMLDAFFNPEHKNHQHAVSMKECYIEITGDKRVTGRVENCDQSRLRESLGIPMREALDSTSLSAALGDAITRRMQTLYQGMADLQAWRKVVKIGNASDFRAQERFRVGGYGNLPAVAESGTYNPLTSPSDDKATYTVSKRGGTENVTLEAIKNDDVNAISAIPGELALAAAHTLYEFVFDFFKDNPAIYDGNALYHASHNNLFAAAFSGAEFAKHRLAMITQSRAGSGKRLATPPKYILLPYELEEDAYNAFVRNQNHDKDFVQSNQPEVLSVNHWTDPNDWVTLADPARLPVIELSFLDGQQEPELFTQDSPTVGSLFTNDTITYKIRHIYGGGVLVDGFKGTTKAIVA